MGLVAIVLAAGRGKRFGGDKLAALVGGRRLLDRAIEAALAAPVERVIVVTGPDVILPVSCRVERTEPLGPDLSDSLRAGLAAAGDAAGAFIFLGDMPFAPAGLATRLARAIGSAIAAMPIHRGEPGHPVLLARAAFELADGVSGDRGLGGLLAGRTDVVRVKTAESGAAFDVDTTSDLAAARQRSGL